MRGMQLISQCEGWKYTCILQQWSFPDCQFYGIHRTMVTGLQESTWYSSQMQRK
jgi:hypothetical protein